MLMYTLSFVIYTGGTAAMIWSGWVAWKLRRPAGALIWTAVLAISAMILLYCALTYHLLSFVTKY